MTTKPTLVRIETNSAAIRAAKSAYPSELSALSEDTPISAHPLSAAAAMGPFTAPIMPPSAYTDFLRVAISSPTVRQGPLSATAPSLQSRVHLRVGGGRSVVSTPTSAASTASPFTDCSCKRPYEDSDDDEDDDEDEDSDDDISTDEEEDEDEDTEIADAEDEECQTKREDRTTPVPESSTLALPTTPFTPQPTSASSSSASGRPTSFPSLQIPPSPSFSVGGTSPRGSPMASPYSATFSATSPSFPYDIEMAKMKAQMDPAGHASSKTVRYRSVVTHTITYTPKISPVPKNKRRRVE
jgi:hypothetical protein